MLIGYARVSTHDQNPELQTDALLKAGCPKEHIYTDTISGASKEHSILEICEAVGVSKATLYK